MNNLDDDELEVRGNPDGSWAGIVFLVVLAIGLLIWF
jgi:hypothetical protein